MRVRRTEQKARGDLAELKIAADLRGRGYKNAFPYGEDYLTLRLVNPLNNQSIGVRFAERYTSI